MPSERLNEEYKGSSLRHEYLVGPIRPHLRIKIGLATGTRATVARYLCEQRRKKMLKGIALWAMGVPIFVIILLYMFIF